MFASIQPAMLSRSFVSGAADRTSLRSVCLVYRFNFDATLLSFVGYHLYEFSERYTMQLFVVLIPEIHVCYAFVHGSDINSANTMFLGKFNYPTRDLVQVVFNIRMFFDNKFVQFL